MFIIKAIANMFSGDSKSAGSNSSKSSTSKSAIERERARAAAEKINILCNRRAFTEIIGMKIKIGEYGQNKCKGADKEPKTYKAEICAEDHDLCTHLGWNQEGTTFCKLFNEEETKMLYKRLKSHYMSLALTAPDAFSMDEISFEDTLCSVCYSNRVGFMLKCEHSFCLECCKSWFTEKGKKDCPLCKAPVEKGGRIDGFKIVNERGYEDKEYERTHNLLIQHIRNSGVIVQSTSSLA